MAKWKILVVDDEPRGVELMERVLRQLGQVLHATSVNEAREILEQEELDAVVTDQRMPGLSGVDLLSLVAEKNDAIGRILITGYADIDATIDAINRGRIHAYLSKPCPPSQLRLTVESVLERAALRRENDNLLQRLVERNRKLIHATRLLRESQRAAETAHQAKSAFLANVSDELRTPLTSIVGWAQLLHEENVGADERVQGADAILWSGSQLLGVINDILEVSRAEAGRLEAVFVEFRLSELFEEIKTFTQQRVDDVKLDLAFEIAPGLDTLVSDPVRLKQILCNLIENALRYTETGSVRVEARISAKDAAEIEFEVSDTGRDIDRASVPHALHPPDRPEDPGQNSAPGIGLGLTICERLTELLCGRLRIQSDPGRSTVVRVTLPRNPGPAG